MFREQALKIIKDAISTEGLLASSQKVDNYARVWSRDSMMTGYAGILIDDNEIVESLKDSILTLANFQAKNGQIPSNVGNGKASYGTLVGRTDATTWWIIVTCEYLSKFGNEEIKDQLKPKIRKALDVLQTWEYNQRGLLYSPLGGNWADEYVTSGYTLYDNVLRYWALKNAGVLFDNEDLIQKASSTKILIENNFRKNSSVVAKYHATAYEKAVEKPYFWASLNANGYDERFDLAGNALALFLDFDLNPEGFSDFLKNLNQEFKHWMLPVFYPIIFPEDTDWKLLENNYSYEFKNQPYHFHNGGSWPIFLGWLCLGLKKKGLTEIPELILKEYEKQLTDKGSDFREYYSTDELLPLGTKKLCFSAAGYILMKF
ncbi:glycoside hydrolase 100 family protein [Halpernia sp. GG3]